MKTGRYKLALFGVYANVYLKIRDILASEVKTLVDEESLIQRSEKIVKIIKPR